jgi:hypothetical protein
MSVAAAHSDFFGTLDGMRAISKHVHGEIWSDDNGRSALLLRRADPEDFAVDSLFLRFAFVTRGREEHILPALVLDDWGKELRGRGLYQWVDEFGERFPRAELFGFEVNGRQTQCFLRALELYARLPCYAYTDRDELLPNGRLLHAILLPSPDVEAPQPIEPPSELQRPLSQARVLWRRIPAPSNSFDFSLLDAPPDPGY